MKYSKLICAGMLATAIAGGSANAARSIVDNEWVTQSTGLPGTSASLNPASLSLTGVTTLSFSPGTSTGGYAIGTISGSPGSTEYAWGSVPDLTIPPAGTFLTTPNEQVVFTKTSADLFSVEFGYETGFGGAGEVASLTVNDTTYTSKAPPSTLGSNDTSNSLLTFTFLDGVLQNASNYLSSWTSSESDGGGGSGGVTAAPEIDPASAVSALTLLAGGLAIVVGSRRRKVTRSLP